jgi:peroxiredoxin
MSQITQKELAPDFTLADFQGNDVTLSQFRGKKHVVLVFNRGFF